MNNRIRTLQTLLRGSRLRNDPRLPALTNELEEVLRVNHIVPLPRRCLMQVLYSTRTLDTTLATFLLVRGVAIAPNQRSLAGYLRRLRNPGVPGMGQINQGEYEHYRNRIANRRNRYMHEAGTNPAGIHEVSTLLNEMHACLVRCLAL
jgi:hypothetical protein